MNRFITRNVYIFSFLLCNYYYCCVILTLILMLIWTFRFQYVLAAATSIATKVNEETLTYLNQGQSYEIKLKKLGDLSAYRGKILKVLLYIWLSLNNNSLSWNPCLGRNIFKKKNCFIIFIFFISSSSYISFNIYIRTVQKYTGKKEFEFLTHCPLEKKSKINYPTMSLTIIFINLHGEQGTHE